MRCAADHARASGTKTAGVLQQATVPQARQGRRKVAGTNRLRSEPLGLAVRRGHGDCMERWGADCLPMGNRRRHEAQLYEPASAAEEPYISRVVEQATHV